MEQERGTKVILQEAMDFADILPDEVWEVIMGKLSDSSDLASCSKASQILRCILDSTISQWMFHEVIPVMHQYLPKAEILKCRQICQEWKKSVDSFFENLADQIHESCLSSPERMDSFGNALESNYLWYSFENTEIILDFCRHLDLTPYYTGRNPIIGRRLSLRKNSTPQNMHERYWTIVMSLLKRFGKELRECRVVIDETPANFLYILKGCLCHLPNLRRLDLRQSEISDIYHPDIGRNRRLNSIREYLLNNKLPLLPHLVHLEVDQRVPKIFYETVFPVYGKQLHTLEIHSSDEGGGGPSVDYEYLFRQPLHTLKVLRIPLPCGSHMDLLHCKKKAITFRGLEVLTLEVCVKCTNSETLFLQVTQHFGRSLKILRLIFKQRSKCPFHFESKTEGTLSLAQNFREGIPHLKSVILVNTPNSEEDLIKFRRLFSIFVNLGITMLYWNRLQNLKE